MSSGIRPGQRQALDCVGALDLLRLESREYATTPEAIQRARAYLEEAGVLPAVPARSIPASVTEGAPR